MTPKESILSKYLKWKDEETNMLVDEHDLDKLIAIALHSADEDLKWWKDNKFFFHEETIKLQGKLKEKDDLIISLESKLSEVRAILKRYEERTITVEMWREIVEVLK